MGNNIGIVLAGGIGRRFGGGKPKQYFPILDKEMIAYSIELFRAAKIRFAPIKGADLGEDHQRLCRGS